ncbi:UNVERIFIED_CONTAM: hypothetical protein PYX00_002020 [Menopon gallinae]|uniref:Uncharacterized protein n=1 Tax=Menopon gallinae TaxID=328185 RepID=A0AAW2IF54_9NEOP
MKISEPSLIGCLVLFVCFLDVCCEQTERTHCPRKGHDNTRTKPLVWLRSAMKKKDPALGAYIVTVFDEHQNTMPDQRDMDLYFLTGFGGYEGFAVVTMKSAALWTTQRFYSLADIDVNCEWTIFNLKSLKVIKMWEWLSGELNKGIKVGADPRTVPNYLWSQWSNELASKGLTLSEMPGLIESIWTVDRPPYKVKKNSAMVIPMEYTGQSWQNKVMHLRDKLTREGSDAMIVTALDEIAWLLNVRGRDTPYGHFVRSFLIVTMSRIYWFVESSAIGDKVRKHLDVGGSGSFSVTIKEYKSVYSELRGLSDKQSRVLIPAHFAYSAGASRSIYSAVPPEKRLFVPSPIIQLKSKKTKEEIEGMKKASLREAALLVDAVSDIGEEVRGWKVTESQFAHYINQYRNSHDMTLGESFPTIVASGKHSGYYHYEIRNTSDREITERGPVILHTGAHYLDGVSELARTFHFGSANRETVNVYTNILKGLIEFSTTSFLSTVSTSHLDLILRSQMWKDNLHYEVESGHGVGPFCGHEESPIMLDHNFEDDRVLLEEGNFLTVEPAYYVQKSYGVRLGNILMVTIRKTIGNHTFYQFEDVTLFPFALNLIDNDALSESEAEWVNDYHMKVRYTVGAELKKMKRMKGYYWLMDSTRDIQYYCKNDAWSRATIHTTLVLCILISAFYY